MTGPGNGETTATAQHPLHVPDAKVLAGGLLSMPILYRLSSATAALYAATSPATKVHGNLSRVYRIQPGG